MVVSLGLGGCSGRPSEGVLIPVVQTVAGAARVPVLVATTRQPAPSDKGEMFSGNRGDVVF